MAKITVVFTRPNKEYRQQDADSLVRDLDGLIEKLNSTFQQDLRDEQSRLTWFTSASSGVNNG
tara:strand:- start:92 stop:280 length:189 start_codon:yes stop_codon:yes gene_type:complete